MTLLEAALDALENNVGEYRVEGAKALLRQAIAEAKKQEPVAWADMAVRGEDKGLSWTPGHFHKTPLYPRPQARGPLPEKRIHELYSFWVVDCQDVVGFARAIERAAHGIKGGA